MRETSLQVLLGLKTSKYLTVDNSPTENILQKELSFAVVPTILLFIKERGNSPPTSNMLFVYVFMTVYTMKRNKRCDG